MNHARLPDETEIAKGTRNWPHAPPHRLEEVGVYFVTARTLGQVHHFHDSARLDLVRDRLLDLAVHYGWRLEAWAVLANHYHVVAHSPDEGDSAVSLRSYLRHLHGDIAREINRRDDATGRKIFHNYRESRLTFQRSYLARLHYTHANAVHHGLVRVAADYPWCSAAAFEKECSPAWVRTIESFSYDEIARLDGDEL